MAYDLIAHVVPKDDDALVELPKARIFDYTRRPMRGWPYITRKRITKKTLEEWVDRGVTFARSLPKKK